MKEVKADHTTWCGTNMLAGVKLADILNDINDHPMINRVNTILTRYDRRLKNLSKLSSEVNADVEYFILLMMNDMKSGVKESKFPIDVETHLLNVMSAKYRKVLKIGKVHG